MKWLLIMTIFLSGCGTVEYVYVPVSSCPAPPVVSMPDLAVTKLPEKPGTKEALKALLEDHINLRETLKQCITIVEGYKPNEL